MINQVNINKDGAKVCIGNIAHTLKELLYHMNKDMSFEYELDIVLAENNIKSLRKLLRLGEKT
jgi:hypothetical protein